MPCFLNLSNHAVRSWPEAQRSAAVALGFGEPVDLVDGMPIVDPTMDSDGVSALAQAIVERAMAQGPAAAHVATEHGLTALLVAELQRHGVRCFTATTERVAREELQPNGVIRLLHEFRFVRWREYARLCRD
jgi:hypothetical protein